MSLLEIVSPKFTKYCPILGTERKKFPITVDDASCHLSCYLNACVYLAPLRRYSASKIMGSRPWSFGVTWPSSASGGRLPMGGPLWPCVYLAPLWRYGPLKSFQEGSSRNRGRSLIGRRSVLNIALISYIPLRYVRNVACEEKKANRLCIFYTVA